MQHGDNRRRGRKAKLDVELRLDEQAAVFREQQEVEW